MHGVHVEVILACAYAGFLVLTALALEWMGRHTQRRSLLYQRRGFTFHQHLDVWECPQGEYLRRAETDPERKLVRYRARADGCNACPMKPFCTDSDTGRELAHHTGDWIETEVGRFHRGLSLALLSLSAMIVVVFWVRHHNALESAILGVSLGALLVLAGAFARALWQKDARPAGSRLIQVSPWTDGARPDGAKRARPFQ